MVVFSSTQPVESRAESDSTAVPKWARHVKISGSILADGRWRQRVVDPPTTANSTTDLYVRLVELALETEFVDFASGTLVLNSEYLGDPRAIDGGGVAVDEVHADLRPRTSIFNFTLGQRTQPFGLFENPLVSDPMAQDGYETKVVGASLGMTGPQDLDLSVTAYKGDAQMEHLFASGLLDPTPIVRAPVVTAHVDSWIAAASGAPWKDVLSVSVSCLSEVGHDHRNLTLDVGLGLNIRPLGNARVDVESTRALQRETLGGQQFHEGVTAITVSHPIVFRPSRLRNRGLYRARRVFTQSHPFNAVVRWEAFRDDGLGRAFGAWTVRDRLAVGGKYTLFEDLPEAVYVAAEIRKTRYRLPSSATAVPGSASEARLRAGVEY